MVDISERTKQIRKLVDAGKYFCINRARQYGKATTLAALKKELVSDYLVLSLDFQGIDNDAFESGATFSQAFARLIVDLHEFEGLPVPAGTLDALEDMDRRELQRVRMDVLFRILKRWIKAAERSAVLIIDEVDSASNNQVFLDFLAQLREGYISREADGVPAFHSVILAGVTDITHLRTKIRPEGEHRVNSPWNIATDFNIDMSLSVAGIKGMLDEYEHDHHTGMDTAEIASALRAYTEGYPFLVSRLCQLLDEEVGRWIGPADVWGRRGIDEAVKLVLAEDNTLFKSLTKNLENYPDLKATLRSVLMEGTRLAWNPQQDALVQLQMYGLIRNDNGTVRVANRLFETMLYNLFLSEEEVGSIAGI